MDTKKGRWAGLRDRAPLAGVGLEKALDESQISLTSAAVLFVSEQLLKWLQVRNLLLLNTWALNTNIGGYEKQT